MNAIAVYGPSSAANISNEMLREPTSCDLASNGAAAFHIEMRDLLPQQLLQKSLPQGLGRPDRRDADT